ncbi:VIT1/CCC1 transporter family protein [Candidatus Sulfidibacterium hydrothermale]|uniref:VIT1/CCC1 transporter family protein n=1 Tax=Candidatus Sulfidibacterium hydrothermale TaxID=2875962 RepID=UPI001F0A5D86|nr:VIT1/CCC1 transporter family protein [Candidatus Sulfidibacterium hydrothermale]UBM61113.1 VIT1/CCC1 transporter family protein [Candidatus Sulfidibacterium hydrothermale]
MTKNINPIYLSQQKAEITEYHVYARLAALCNDEKNKTILLDISNDELRHYQIWKNITGKECKPNKWKVFWYVMLARVFGLSFALKLMESGEIHAQAFYEKAAVEHPEVSRIAQDEEDHEKELLAILNDKRLAYVGAIVLGLNDALVELTGTLVGLSFAFNDNEVIGVTGLIMGIAAALSMAASGYLASQEEEEKEDVNPITAAVYTGVAYLITVALLVFPYFLVTDPRTAMGIMLLMTLLIIAGYNYYISVAKTVNFKKRFLTMALISLGVAAISFGIGYLAKAWLGVSI